MIQGSESSNASIKFIAHQYLLQILEKNKYEQQNKQNEIVLCKLLKLTIKLTKHKIFSPTDQYFTV